MLLSKSVSEKIQAELDRINPIFGVMWKHGDFKFSDEYDTAALEVVDGKFVVTFNPKYWKKLNKYNRTFIICHEYLHIILGHWLQSKNKNIDAEWENIAQDIQVNEMLTRTFGFCRDNIKNWKEQCWIDVVFKNHAHLIQVGQSSSYYYKLIIECVAPVV